MREASRGWTCWSAAAAPSPPRRGRRRRRSSCWTACARWASPSWRSTAPGCCRPIGALDDSEIGEGMGVLRDDLLVPLGAAVVSRAAAARGSWRCASRSIAPGGPISLRSRCVAAACSRAAARTRAGGRPGDRAGRRRHARRRRARARRLHATVSGGAVGLILDARDMPLGLPRRSEDRRAVLAGWRDTFLREPALPAAAVTP